MHCSTTSDDLVVLRHEVIEVAHQETLVASSEETCLSRVEVPQPFLQVELTDFFVDRDLVTLNRGLVKLSYFSADYFLVRLRVQDIEIHEGVDHKVKPEQNQTLSIEA